MIVAVLAGGRSSEHDVSLASAASVRAGLRGGRATRCARSSSSRDGTWTHDGDEVALRPGRGLLGADVAFPVLHGPFGEDGTVQGLLELLDVPYVGSGVAASAVCMDKLLLKDLMAAAGMPQVAYGAARSDDASTSAGRCWVKPARLGSSVGIVRVERPEDLDDAIATAREHDPRVIVEAHCAGLEIECSVLGDEASEPGEIVLQRRRLVRLRGEVHAGRDGAASCPRGSPTTARERVRELAVARVRARRLRGPGPRRLLRRRRATCCSTSSTRCPA